MLHNTVADVEGVSTYSSPDLSARGRRQDAATTERIGCSTQRRSGKKTELT